MHIRGDHHNTAAWGALKFILEVVREHKMAYVVGAPIRLKSVFCLVLVVLRNSCVVNQDIQAAVFFVEFFGELLYRLQIG